MNDVFTQLQKAGTPLEICGHRFFLKPGGRLKKRERTERIDKALEAYNAQLQEAGKKLEEKYPVVPKIKNLIEAHREAIKRAEELNQPLPMFDASQFSEEENLQYIEFRRLSELAKDEPLLQFAAVVAEVLNLHKEEGQGSVTTQELIDEFDEQALFALADVAKNGAMEGPNLEAVSLKIQNSPHELSLRPSPDTTALN